MKWKILSYVLAPALLCAMAQPSMAFGHRCRRGCAPACSSPVSSCNSCAAPVEVQYQEVKKTIMVPTWVTETRTVNVTECVPEQRTKTYTVYKQVPETKDVTYQYTIYVPETRTRTVTYTVCKPVTRNEEQEYTVMVPYTETRQGTRRVCKLVPVVKKRVICEDQGHWEEVPCQSVPNCSSGCASNDRTSLIQQVGWRKRCGNCAPGCAAPANCASPAPCATVRRWVPNIVKREVEYTCMQAQMEDVPYEYTVTLCRPEKRTRTIQVCDMVREQQSKEVQYTVCVPQTKTGTRQVTVCKTVPEEKTCTYTVNVPHTVQKEIQVQVCKMVPKEITCRVPVQVNCGTCAPCAP